MDIRTELISRRDEKYRDFQSGLIPDLDKAHFLGVRTPELRKLARLLVKSGEAADFMAQLPHKYFDEDQLHALIIGITKDFRQALAETERFLPYVRNWATCDQLRPSAFKGRQTELLPRIRTWLDSGECYKIRFGMEMLMLHYLGDCFEPKFLGWVGDFKSEEYYVKMIQAWYFAEALALQYDHALPYITEGLLDTWVNNKAIQKARESLKIPDDRKELLVGYRRKV